MLKPSYLTNNCKDKGVHAFPKGISLKVNKIVWLEFKLTYSQASIQLFNHYTTHFDVSLNI